MKIINFKGTKVHDYISIDVDFNSDLSIVTGVNGSGKTTAIILMQAILCPNLKDLIKIPFESLELTFSNSNSEYKIEAKTEKNIISLKVNHINELLMIDRRKIEEYEYFQFKQKEEIEINEYIAKSFISHSVMEFIQGLPSPIFIGLERRIDESQNEKNDFLIERRMFINNTRHEISQYKRQFKGTLGVSLLETEFLVQAMYKKLRKIEDGYTSAIQKQILLSYFDYITFDPSKDLVELNNYNEKRELLSRQQEIVDALKKIGYDNNAFVQKLNPFFSKLEALIDSIKPNENEKEKRFSIEWLINKSQVDKLAQLVEVIDEYNVKINKAFKPIIRACWEITFGIRSEFSVT